MCATSVIPTGLRRFEVSPRRLALKVGGSIQVIVAFLLGLSVIHELTAPTDEELLDAMISAGLHQVFFGIESGDVDSLRKIRKEMPLQQIRDAVAMTRRRKRLD